MLKLNIVKLNNNEYDNEYYDMIGGKPDTDYSNWVRNNLINRFDQDEQNYLNGLNKDNSKKLGKFIKKNFKKDYDLSKNNEDYLIRITKTGPGSNTGDIVSDKNIINEIENHTVSKVKEYIQRQQQEQQTPQQQKGQQTLQLVQGQQQVSQGLSLSGQQQAMQRQGQQQTKTQQGQQQKESVVLQNKLNKVFDTIPEDIKKIIEQQQHQQQKIEKNFNFKDFNFDDNLDKLTELIKNYNSLIDKLNNTQWEVQGNVFDLTQEQVKKAQKSVKQETETNKYLSRLFF